MDAKDKTGLTITLAITFAIICFCSIAVLSDIPTGLSLDQDNNLVLSTMIGSDEHIPMDQIEVIDMPEGLLDHLYRTNGTSIGAKKYGQFRNTKSGQDMFLFLTGKEQKACFTYKGKLYVTDDWR